MALSRDTYEDNYADPYKPTPPQPAKPEDLYGGIGAAYKQYLGRDASQDELAFHAKTSPTNFDDVIKGSSEAQAWNARGSQPAAAPAPTSAPQYGGGTAYNSQGGLQQSFWQALGVTGGAGTITPGLLQSKAGELQKLGISVVSQDKIRLPDGTIVDVAGDFNPQSGGAAVWQDPRFNADGSSFTGQQGGGAGGGGFGGGGSFGGGGDSGGGGGSSSSNSFSSSQSGYGSDAQRDALYNHLLQRSQQGLQIGRDDPNVRSQADPYAAVQEKARRDYIADAAERKGPLTNLQGEERLAMERAGHASGMFESQLIGKELTARRDEITHALDSMRGMLTQEQELQLRSELAQLDDKTRRLGLEYQNSQAAGQLQNAQNQTGLDYSQFDWLRDPRNPNNIPLFNGDF